MDKYEDGLLRPHLDTVSYYGDKVGHGKIGGDYKSFHVHFRQVTRSQLLTYDLHTRIIRPLSGASIKSCTGTRSLCCCRSASALDFRCSIQ